MSGKQNISEEEASSLFVTTFVKKTRAEWPAITKGLLPFLTQGPPPLDSGAARLEFTLAFVASEMQALGNLFPDRQAALCANMSETGSTPVISVEGAEVESHGFDA